MAAEPLAPEAKVTALARAFPSMATAPHVRLWDANRFDRWTAETPLSHGEFVTARFLLAVWNPGHAWACGRFDLMEAVRIWDDDHRRVFLAWAEAPWWP